MTPRGLGWLLRRVLSRDMRTAPGRRVALVLGAFVLCALAIGTVGTLQLLSMQHDRSVALSPTLAGGERTRDAGLQVIDPQLVTDRRWHSHAITRQLYTGDGSGPDIAGIPRLPNREEYFASPALVELISQDRVVAALFEGRRLAGVIESSGLVHPHELRAIGGAPNAGFGLVPVTGFGNPPSPAGSLDDFSTLNRSVGILVVLTIWVPGVTLLIVTSRLAAAETRRRVRSLHLVGVSRFAVRAFHSVEIGIFVLGGALLGAVAFHGWIRTVTQVPWTDAGYFTSDIDPGLLLTGVIVIAITLCAMASAGWAADPGRTAKVRRASRRFSSPHRTRLPVIGLAMCVGALIYLVGLTFVPEPPGWAVLGMWIADGALAVGLGLCGPALVTAAFARLSSVVRRGGVLVGVRAQSRRPSTSLRLGALLAVVIVLIIGSLSFINVLQHGGSKSWDDALAKRSNVPVVVVDIGDTLTLPGIDRVAPGTHPVELVEGRTDNKSVAVLIGDCEDLTALSGEGPDGCSGHPQWIAVTKEPLPERDRQGMVRIPGRGIVTAPGPDAVVDVSPRLPKSWHGALLVPQAQPGVQAGGGDGAFFLLAPSAELSQTLAALGGAAPTVQFRLGDLTFSDPYAARFPVQVTWLVVGASVAIGLGALGLVSTIIGEARERSARMRGLRTLGAARTDLALAHTWATAAPVVAMGWLAVGAGLVVAVVMYSFDSRAQVEWGAALILALASMALALLASLMTLPNAFSTSRRSGGLKA